MYDRHIAPIISKALLDTPVVVLTGARQTGKSTLVQSLAQSGFPARYLTLDDIGVLAAAKHDPVGFLAGLEGPVILDEIQRAEELFLAIKAAVDRDRKPGRFLLTGSADVMLLPKLSRALVGRMEVLTLWPLSQGEIEGLRGNIIDTLFDAGRPLPQPKASPSREIWARVVRGGYPEPLAREDPARRQAWFKSYIAALLDRDVRDLANIEGLTQLPRLLQLAAARTAGLLNFSELSRSIGLPQTTLKRYLALLEATFLVRRLPAWNGNLGKRVVKAPKLLVNDTGLAAQLLGVEAERLDGNETLRGPLLESFVAAEFLKQAEWSKIKPHLYHFRTGTGQEVDLVLEDARGRCVGIEVKAAASVAARDFAGLNILKSLLKGRLVRGIVLHTGDGAIPFAEDLHALPISSLWRT